MRMVLPATLVLLAAWAAAGAAPRTWTDTTGKFKITAELVDVQEGKARLRRDDETILTVPLAKLSRADQRFVREELKRRKAESTPAKPAASATREVATDWPQWRGPGRTGISQETGLLDAWPAEGPPIVWQAKGLGKGYSSVTVTGGKIYTLGTRQGGEHLIALDAQSGDEVWAAPIGRADHSNSTPTVNGKLVFAVGLNGDLVCVDAETGKEVWRKNFKSDFGGRMMSGWGYSESPLVDGDRLICTPGAPQAMMAALEKNTGKVIWTTAMPGDVGSQGKDGAGYSSIVVSQAAGTRQYVQLVGRGVIGVDAKDGSLLWGYNKIANGTANIPTPIVRDDFVLCSTGYNDGGTALLQLSRSGGGIAVKEVYYRRAGEMQNHHGGMVLIGDHVYFGHGHNKGLPACVELTTGKFAWGPDRGPGGGSAAIAYADGHIYLRYEDAKMALIEATPSGYRLKGAFTIASRNGKSWPHPVIAGGHLYLRDQDELHCYNIRKQ